jgi:hypothetical protein
MTQPVDITRMAAEAPGAAEPLPERSRALDVANFERLYAQAHEQQTAVQFTNPAHSMAHQSIGGVTRAVSASSREYLGTVDAGIASVARLDLQNPQSIANVFHHFTAVTLQSTQLTVMLGEVTNAKKSVQELFHSQG